METNRGQLVIDLRPILESVVEEVSGREVTHPQRDARDPSGRPRPAPRRHPRADRKPRGRIARRSSASGGCRPDRHRGQGYLLGVHHRSLRSGHHLDRDRRRRSAHRPIRHHFDRSPQHAQKRRYHARCRRRDLARPAHPVLDLAGQEFARSPDAALAIINNISENFRYQSFAHGRVRRAPSIGAVLAGPTRLRDGDPFAGPPLSVRPFPANRCPASFESTRACCARRASSSARLLLIAWPDPTARVYVTILGLLAVYLGANLAGVQRQRIRAARAPARFRSSGRQHFAAPVIPVEGEPSRLDWFIARAAWLRVIGIVVVRHTPAGLAFADVGFGHRARRATARVPRGNRVHERPERVASVTRFEQRSAGLLCSHLRLDLVELRLRNPSRTPRAFSIERARWFRSGQTAALGVALCSVMTGGPSVGPRGDNFHIEVQPGPYGSWQRAVGGRRAQQSNVPRIGDPGAYRRRPDERRDCTRAGNQRPNGRAAHRQHLPEDWGERAG